MKKVSMLTGLLFVLMAIAAFAQTPTPTPTPYSQPTPSWILSTERLAGQGSDYGDILNRPAKTIFGELQGLWALFQTSHNVDGTIKPDAIPTPTPAPTATPFVWETQSIELPPIAIGTPAPAPANSGLILFSRPYYEGARSMSRGSRPLPPIVPYPFMASGGIEKQIATFEYDTENARAYLDPKYLPTEAMTIANYGAVNAEATPVPNTVIKATILKDVTTGNEITAIAIENHVNGKVVARLPDNVNDDITATGTNTVFMKYNGGVWELWVHFQDGTEKLLADSVAPTPTPTPTP